VNGVALSGKAGSGKTTLANILCEKMAGREMWPTQLSFGDHVKAELFRLHGIRKGDPGSREALIGLGALRRNEDPDYWVKLVEAQLDSLSPYGVVPVVTDLRFTNEKERMAGRGLVTVRVDATGMDRGYQLYRRGEQPEFAYSGEPGECQLDDADFDIRFWNPHGDNAMALHHISNLLCDLFVGSITLEAAKHYAGSRPTHRVG
jgi:hypothetical protein